MILSRLPFNVLVYLNLKISLDVINYVTIYHTEKVLGQPSLRCNIYLHKYLISFVILLWIKKSHLRFYEKELASLLRLQFSCSSFSSKSWMTGVSSFLALVTFQKHTKLQKTRIWKGSAKIVLTCHYRRPTFYMSRHIGNCPIVTVSSALSLWSTFSAESRRQRAYWIEIMIRFSYHLLFSTWSSRVKWFDKIRNLKCTAGLVFVAEPNYLLQRKVK